MFRSLAKHLAAVSLSTAAAFASAAQPATIRVDYLHSGNALEEHYGIKQVLIEPLPWPGNLAQNFDNTDRGNNRLEVVDQKTGALLYSRGFSTVFAEWKTTGEAGKINRGFEESVRFPDQGKPVRVHILKRDERNAFSIVWSIDVDPAAPEVIRKQPPAPAPVLPIRVSGASPDKVDLLVLGDGYTQADMKKFEADVRRLTDRLFQVSPFKERANDFNVWAMAVPTQEAGVSRPSSGVHHASSLGVRYDAFGLERYVLALDNAALRNIAQYAPYEFIEILVNNETYGGGGIFGQFSTAAASNESANYLFVHEFGHHFAGLADEYYTSPVAYIAGTERREPWEPNATALHDPAMLKWKSKVKPGTPLPTPWPKAEYEKLSREYMAQRIALRTAMRPESEMNRLSSQFKARSDALFAAAPEHSTVGAFEGANYQASGFYRPEMQCIMFDRSGSFCSVCADAIVTTINLYARPR